MLYTSYYAKTKRICSELDNVKLVAISRTSPLLCDYHFLGLAPDWSTLKNWKESVQDEKAKKEYSEEYIRKLSANEVSINEMNKVIELSKDYNVVLLCYEKSSSFCHRHLLSDYMNKIYRTDIKEL